MRVISKLKRLFFLLKISVVNSSRSNKHASHTFKRYLMVPVVFYYHSFYAFMIRQFFDLGDNISTATFYVNAGDNLLPSTFTSEENTIIEDHNTKIGVLNYTIM